MSEEYVGVALTVVGLVLVLAGIVTVLSVTEGILAIISVVATVGLCALATGCVLLYRVVGRHGHK